MQLDNGSSSAAQCKCDYPKSMRGSVPRTTCETTGRSPELSMAMVLHSYICIVLLRGTETVQSSGDIHRIAIVGEQCRAIQIELKVIASLPGSAVQICSSMHRSREANAEDCIAYRICFHQHQGPHQDLAKSSRPSLPRTNPTKSNWRARRLI